MSLRRTACVLAGLFLITAVVGCSGDSKKITNAKGSSQSGVSSDASGNAPSDTSSTASSDTSATSDTSAATDTGGTVNSGFAAEGNAICKRYQSQINSVPSNGSDAKAQGAALEKLVGIADKEISDLKKLSPPSSVATKWKKLMGDLTKAAAKIHAAASKFSAGDAKGGQAELAQIDSVTSTTDSDFDSFGMKTCGSNSSGSSGSSDTGTVANTASS